jgi:hypothetical protein
MRATKTHNGPAHAADATSLLHKPMQFTIILNFRAGEGQQQFGMRRNFRRGVAMHKIHISDFRFQISDFAFCVFFFMVNQGCRIKMKG